MKFRDTNCCAWQEISNLSSHVTPLDAMKAFCQANLNQVEARVAYHSMNANQNRLYSFYLFSAAVKTPGSKQESYTKEVGADYGSKFAKFILENKFGEIVESPIRPNMAFHTDHSNRLWIWAPDQARIQSWWKEEQAKEAKQKEEAEKLHQEMVKALPKKGIVPPAAKPGAVQLKQVANQIYWNVPIPCEPPPPEDDDYELPDYDEDDNDD